MPNAAAAVEVEVKLRLLGARAYRAMLKALSAPETARHLRTESQTNHILDTAGLALFSRRTVLRMREYDVCRPDEPGACKKYVLYVKSNPVLKDGISRVDEEEAVVPDAVAAKIIADPGIASRYAERIPPLSRLLERVTADGAPDLALTNVGSFRTVRRVFAWRGYTLEIDRVDYGDPNADRGSSAPREWTEDAEVEKEEGEKVYYEIELETPEPEIAKAELVAFLRSHGVPYEESTKNKVQIMFDLLRRPTKTASGDSATL